MIAAFPAGARRLCWTVLLIAIACFPISTLHAQPTDHPPDTIAARLLACAACHGPQGQGTDNDYFPRLAGKPAGYLLNQLVAFRDGHRRYPPMNYLLEYIPDSYLHQMRITSPHCALRQFRKRLPM